jgi:hypothetical protein
MNADPKNVIRGLECCSNRAGREPAWNSLTARNCGKCPYDKPGIACTRDLAYDALELLKAQEPRVMTICEIQSFHGAVYVDEPKNPVCLKMLYCYEVGQRTYGHGYTFVDSDGDNVFYSAQGFGTKWRCWTSRPTDEQREAVKWE